MYTPILASLGFVLSPDRKKTLLIHRNKRKKDQHLGKFNGLGGKMEAGEDIFSCLSREIFEEAGIVCLEATLRGTINWTGFGKNGEDWFGFIYLIEQFQGEPFLANEEGDLEWHDLSRLSKLPMWKGDKYFLPLIFDSNPKMFHGYMPYREQQPLSWSFIRS